MTFYLSPIDGEVLVALAWAAPLATPMLRQLVAPWMTDTGLRKHLAKLSAAGYIDGRLCYRQGIGGRAERIGHVWSLTERGAGEVPEDRRPAVVAKVRGSLIDHDLVAGRCWGRWSRICGRSSRGWRSSARCGWIRSGRGRSAMR